MRRPAWILAAATMMVASTAMAQGVKLVPGEEVVFTLEGGKPVAPTRSKAKPTPFEAAVGAHLSGQKPPAAPVTEGTPIYDDSGFPAAPVPEAGKIRFRFFQIPGTSHALLVVHNGYALALTYRAQITVKGKTDPTDVCLVMSGKPSVEHWPYAIAAMEVGAFELVDWKEGDAVPCK